ncbi:hypothetical protein UlMin_034044 [Ulmus minor]
MTPKQSQSIHNFLLSNSYTLFSSSFSFLTNNMKRSSYLSFTSSPLLFFLVYVLSITITEAAVKLPANKTVPAVFMFGDSIVDTGNNNENIKSPARSNFPPYGKDFEGGIPTGRYSNGKVPSDFLVEELGIKELLPPYLDKTLTTNELLTGVCFAVGGVGFDPFSSTLAIVPTLDDQLANFKEYIKKITRLVGVERTNFILANSVIFVVASSNDIATTYYGSGIPRLKYDINSYTDLMIRYAAKFVKDLYNVGGRRIAVLSAPPIGCVPSQRTVGGGLERGCSENLNSAAKLFNSKLEAELTSLGQSLPDENTRVVYLDVYNPLLDIINNPLQYGFKIANKGCCGTGLIEVSIFCNQLESTCKDDSIYVFWDSFHPTENTYRIIVKQLINNYLNSFL